MESPHFEVHFATELEAKEGVGHDVGPWVERNLDLRTFHPHLRSCSLISRTPIVSFHHATPERCIANRALGRRVVSFARDPLAFLLPMNHWLPVPSCVSFVPPTKIQWSEEQVAEHSFSPFSISRLNQTCDDPSRPQFIARNTSPSLYSSLSISVSSSTSEKSTIIAEGGLQASSNTGTSMGASPKRHSYCVSTASLKSTHNTRGVRFSGRP